MGFSAATLLYALAYHAYGPKPEGPPRLEQGVRDVAGRARHWAVSNAAYAVLIAGVAGVLGRMLLRRSDGVDLPHAVRSIPGLGVAVARHPGRDCMMGELLAQVLRVEAQERASGAAAQAPEPTEGEGT